MDISRQHVLRITSGLAVGLFLARTIAEVTRVPWSPLALAALAVVSCGVFVWLARWLDRRGTSLPLVSVLVLLVYVFWLQRDWTVALSVASIALLSWLISLLSRATQHSTRFSFHVLHLTLYASRSTFIDVLTFIVAFVVYLATLQKDILPADSGEFQVAVTMLGVLHQPGFPLYTLVGKLITLLPIGTPALRLNLMSALLAAGTLTLVGVTVRRMLGTQVYHSLARRRSASETPGQAERSEESPSRRTETLRPKAAQGDTVKPGAVWGGVAAVLALGTATTFWAQATTTNIRMPTVFFTAWCLYLLVAYRQSQISAQPASTRNFKSQISKDRYLTLFALAFSLGFGHYFPLAGMGLFFVMYLVLVEPALVRQPRRWWRPLAIFALAQLVWLYLPIHAAIAPTRETRGLTSLGGFLWYAMGQGFGGDFLAFAGPEHLPARLALLPTLFPFQMNLVLLAAALLGAVLLIWCDWRAALMLIGGFLLHTFIAITYRAPQTIEYAMPTYVMLAVMIGYGVGQISNIKYRMPDFKFRIPRGVSQIGDLKLVLIASVIVAGLANGVAHAPSYITLANDHSTREYVEPILRNAPQGAIILSDWHYATPMWYLQQVEGLRRDVEVRYVYPVPGQEISQVWRALIETSIVSRTVIVTHYWGVQYSTMPYTLEPFGQAWLVRDKPSFDLPRGLTPLSVIFGGEIRLVGYDISLSRTSPGRPLDVTLAWQTIDQLGRDYSLTVQLMDENGGRRTNRDHNYPTRTFAPGEVHVDHFTLPLEPTLPPGQYTIGVGVYFVSSENGFRNLTTTDGEPLAKVTTFELVPSEEPPPTLHPLDVPFVGGPTLTGVDYDLSIPSSLRVYLHWRGPSSAGVVARIGEAIAALPQLPRGAVLITGHDVPMASLLRLSLTDAGGRMQTGVGAWGWPISDVPLPAPSLNDRFVMLSDQMVLTDVYAPRHMIAPGQPIDVTLRFLSLKPLVTSYEVSVQVERVGASDDRPAANAVPTFKWIAGSVVDDGRRLVVPADAQPGRVSGHLRVYDEFREDVLPPLDARMGDSVPLGEWSIER